MLFQVCVFWFAWKLEQVSLVLNKSSLPWDLLVSLWGQQIWLTHSWVQIRSGKWYWKIGGEGEGLRNPSWEVYSKNLHKSKIKTCGKVKCKCHIMSKKERTFPIYSIFSFWKRDWRREQVTKLIQCFGGCSNVQQDWKWNTYLILF